MRHDYYVYAYLDPRKPGAFCYKDIAFDFEPFYIGKGCGHRMRMHLWESTMGANFKSYKIKKIQSVGLSPVMLKVQALMTEEDAYSLEEKLIKLIGRQCDGGPLTNIELGGTRPPVEEETRIKISRALKGRVITKEWRERISRNNAKYWKGKPMSRASVLGLRKSRKNQDMSYRLKAYKATSPNGKVFIVEDGLEEFCRLHGLGRPHMIAVAKGRRTHHKNWKCEYVSGLSIKDDRQRRIQS